MVTMYLEQRVLNERPGGAPYLLRIRDVAKQLSQETADDRDEYEYIRQLCSPALERCSNFLSQIWSDAIERPREHFFSDSTLDSDVYAAALYTQTLPVVARWMSSGKPGDELLVDSFVFGNTLKHAIRHCNQDVIAAMLDIDHEYILNMRRGAALGMAAEFGHVDLTRLIWNIKIEQFPWVCKRKARPSYLADNARTVAALETPSMEIFNMITEKRRIHLPDKIFGVTEFTRFLVRSARKGWLDMSAYYLTRGARVDGEENEPNYRLPDRPLVEASKNGHREVVKLLLDHGADTSQPALETAVRYGHFDVFSLLLEHGAETGGALGVAVAKGYRSVVDALLQHRSHSKEELQSVLPRAIEIEDKAIFQALTKHVQLDDATREACAKVAEENGLESMAELL